MKHGADWYKREPRAMLDATRAAKMTSLQAAIYNLVIDLIYEGAGETPNDPVYFAAHYGDVTPEKAAAAVADLVAMEKLILVGKNLTQKRAKREAKSKESIAEARSKAGRIGGIKSGEARRNNDLQRSNEAKNEAKRSREEKRREDKIREDIESSTPTPAGDGGGFALQPLEFNQKEFPQAAVERALKLFASMAESVGLPIPRELTAKRRSAIGARIRDHGENQWNAAIEKIRQSPFLRGETGRGTWRGADIDWLIAPSNFIKVIEGKYDGPRSHQKPADNQPAGVVDDLQEAVRRAEERDLAGRKPD